MDISTVLLWYFYILPPFVLQLAVTEAMFCFRLKRNPWFLLRLIAGVLICAGALWFAACAMAFLGAVGAHGVWIAPVYLTIFLMTVGVMKICFEESFPTLLFYGIAAYATQNLAYRIYNMFEMLGLIWRLNMFIGIWQFYLPFHLLAWCVVFVAVAAVAYVAFTRPMIRRDVAHLRDLKVYALSCAALVITTFLSSWTDAYSAESQMLTLIAYLFSCCCCVFILALQSGMLHTEGIKQDLEVVKRLWEQDRKQYEISRENIDIINIKCHDLRFRLQSLRTAEGEVSREELEEIENAITIYDSRITTGCEALDTILTEKSLFCSKNDIKFTCMADGSKLSFIMPADIYSLFGNIISNAVEAVQKVEDKEYRLITLEVKQVGDMLLVAMENYFSGSLVVRAGMLVTSKGNEIDHGFGMKSIQMLVRKYGGDMDVDARDNIFTLKLLFPLAS